MADMLQVPILAEAGKAIPAAMVTTTSDVPHNFRPVTSLGIVKGVSVRTRNICADILIGLNALVGGKNYLLTQLFKDTRQEAYNNMLAEAVAIGGNCIVNVRYDTTELGVLCYGTACTVVPK
jgi:uncharacterized protein YbjQ (UPF0145 family)